jgi:mannose-6-phosphate isomerase-like protein (cupin superfamily)
MQQEQNKLERLIRRGQDATFTDEYNCKLRRLFPWPEKVNTKRGLTEFGCMYVTLAPGDDVDLHNHDEEETFIVVSGEAILHVDGEETIIRPGDVAYIPRFSKHQLRNQSASIPYQMLDVYWDENGTSDATLV